jgi:hypothetical protein
LYKGKTNNENTFFNAKRKASMQKEKLQCKQKRRIEPEETLQT